jgi:hypothetical protein
MANKRRSLETILVASGNQAVVADGSTALTDASGNCNLASGQLGIFHAGLGGTSTMDTAINSGDTIVESPEIYIAMGTPDAANPGFKSNGMMGVTNLKSHRIAGRETTTWKGAAYTAPVLPSWVIGADAGATDAVGTPLNLTEYSVNISFAGRRHDEAFTIGARDSVRVKYTTPDYSTLGTTNPLDHFIQNMVNEINKNSRLITTNGRRGNKPILAVAVRFEGSFSGTGASIGDGSSSAHMSDLTGGVSFPGTYYGISTDAETGSGLDNSQMAAAFAALRDGTDNDVDATTQVCAVDLATAGTNASGANGIILIGLDELTAYEDRIPEVKTYIKVGLDGGFLSTVGAYDAEGTEGGWSTRQIKLKWNEFYNIQLNSSNRLLDPIINNVDIDDLLTSTAVYDVYVIASGFSDIKTISPSDFRKGLTWIFVPTTGTTTKANLEAALNGYFGSANLPTVNV